MATNRKYSKPLIGGLYFDSNVDIGNSQGGGTVGGNKPSNPWGPTTLELTQDLQVKATNILPEAMSKDVALDQLSGITEDSTDSGNAEANAEVSTETESSIE